MKAKKFLALFMALTMSVSMLACTKDSVDPSKDPDLNADAGADVDLEDDGRNKEVYSVVATRATDYNFASITPTEFVKAMGLGWNLGNTLDSTGGDGTDVIKHETSWGNPEVTKELIQSVADLGFTTIRIPITWYMFVDKENGYKINPDYLNRVQQIVDWALDEGLFVIINTHHDTGGDNENAWLIPDSTHYEETSAELCAIWAQVAEHFKDYDERLIFEGMNEPRVGNNWNGSKTNNEVVNDLGLDFVKTVRAAGGYNETRFLMVPGYAASSNSNIWKNYRFPENDERVILSIHAYMPYDFALNTKGTSEWDVNKTEDTHDIDQLFKNIHDVLILNGHVAVIGEFGNMAKGNNLDDRIACTAYFTNLAKLYGIPIVWWDNNAFSNGETFGLIRRNMNNSCLYTGIVEAMIDNWYDTDFTFSK